jgi:hypothetical protein
MWVPKGEGFLTFIGGAGASSTPKEIPEGPDFENTAITINTENTLRKQINTFSQKFSDAQFNSAYAVGRASPEFR